MQRERKIIEKEYDVVVVGGGLSGICSALASARNGAKTAIVQARPVFCGNNSSEVRMHVCGANCHAVKKDLAETGILMELQLLNKKVNDHHSFPVWDTVMWGKLKYEKNLTCYLNTTMDEVVMDDKIIKSIICRQATTETTYKISAKIFVDATGNGTLGYFAGAEYRYGSEAKSEFNEPDAPEVENGYTMGNTILFHSTDMGENTPFLKPKWAYDFKEEDLQNRPHGNVTWSHGENGVVEEYNVSSGYWWLELGGESKNIIEETEKINEELYKCLFGVWDHIKNGEGHNAENYALDWVGAVPGIRESRRLVGDYILNENDILDNRYFDDGVAFGGWPIDVHPKEGLYHKGLPTKYINFSGHYSIPYRCFYSKNVPNLMMAGRDISVSKLAMASTRVMGTCAIGGQAVGTACAIAVKYGCSAKDVGEKYIKELQQTLLKQDCYIPGVKNEDQKDFARNSKILASSFTVGNEPEKVVSGVTRALGEQSNVWESQSLKNNPQWIEFSLGEQKEVSQVRVVFDPDLNKEIMITQTKRRQDTLVKGMPHTLVKDYSVKAYLGDKVVFEKNVKDNIERLAVIDIENGVQADKIVVGVQSAYGIDNARIFEVRIY
jgi:hypothetical protein